MIAGALRCGRTAVEVCKHFPLGEDAGRLLAEGLTAEQYLEVLIGQHQYLDAVRFLAHALPKREAVWWGCLCVREAYGRGLPAAGAAALQAAERWATTPDEDNRRAAFAAAEAAGLGTPAGIAAVAAFWSGGSLGPPHVKAIPPAEHLTGQGVAGAVLLAAVVIEPEKAVDKYRRFFQLGEDVARGTNRWQTPEG